MFLSDAFFYTCSLLFSIIYLFQVVHRKRKNCNKKNKFVLTADEYTHLMMKRSTIPEIAALVNADSAIDEYWNDTSDNIQVVEQNIDDTTRDSKLIKNNENKKRKTRLHLSVSAESDKQDLLSPNLKYDIFALSPNTVCFEKNDLTKESNVVFQDKDESKKTTEKDCVTSEFESPFIVGR